MMKLLATLALALPLAAALETPPLPTFSQDVTSQQTANMVIHQGQYIQQGGDYCCDSRDSCEVQVQSQDGTNYVWYSHNLTRFDQIGGQDQTIINDFNHNKEMLIVNNTCQSFCPINEPLFPFNLEGTNATYNGTTEINGVTVQHWAWKETILGGAITMSTTDFYCTEPDSNGLSRPVTQLQHLTPFGQPIGQQNNTWETWTAGAPKASLFDIQGEADCPESNQCGNNQNLARAMNRLRNRMWKTWLHYQFQ